MATVFQEIVANRTRNSKTWDFADGSNRRRLITSLVSIHVPSDYVAWRQGQAVDWQNLDLSTVEEPDETVRLSSNAWYDFDIGPRIIGYRITSKFLDGGTATLVLTALDGVALTVGGTPRPRRDGNEIWWDNVAPDLDIYLRLDPDFLEFFKRIKGPASPKQFRWRLAESVGNEFVIQTDTDGFDNADMLEPTRAGLGVGSIRRRIRMQNATISDDTTAGERVRVLVERWTGETIALDANRVPSFSTDVVYPVLIDATLNLSIAADGDDGDERVGAAGWENNYKAGNHIIYRTGAGLKYLPGYRFTTVTIPQGATINSATFGWTIQSSSSGAGGTATLYGYNVDNAGAWTGTTIVPSQVAKTTANVAYTPWAGSASGAKTLSVTAIVQEIINRAGWASGNALSLFVDSATLGSTLDYSYITDRNGGTSNVATLTIDYTAGAAVGADTLMTNDLFPKPFLRRPLTAGRLI